MDRTEEARDDAHRFKAAPRAPRRRLASLAVGVVAAVAVALPVASAGGGSGPQAAADALDPDTAFYVPKPNHDAIEQIAALRAAGAAWRRRPDRVDDLDAPGGLVHRRHAG